MRLTIIILSVAVLLGGCDVPGYIEVKNCTDTEALYLTYSETPDGMKDTIMLEVPANETKGMLFGFGQHWTDVGIREYLSQINNIEIMTSQDTISINDRREMYQYFRKRRKGSLKPRLKIKIE